MPKELPLGVKVTRILNWISMVYFFGVGVFALVLMLANALKTANGGQPQTNPLITLAVGLIGLCLLLIPVLILFFINEGLGQLSPKARIWQVIVSILLMLVFPVGTILNMGILYFMIFDRKTTAVFATPPS